jgi:hypothetical protein
MHSIRTAISILASVATLAVSLPTFVAASPLNVTGQSPDLDRYCQRYYGAEARLTSYSALGWQCHKSVSQTWGISVSRACQDQFGMPKASYRNKNDPYSWYCHKPAPKPVGVDLTRYCVKHFGQGVKAKLVGGTALDWVCAHGANSRWGISVSTACKEQHGLPKASYSDRSNPYSWYCHR